ncbi:MAG: hypothetical protein E6J72_11760 [Deltaproteobacteria bacterium]|nr:MAG: hypothetical protein E6J72_11760 [Deltaproteobacteria bacterium]
MSVRVWVPVANASESGGAPTSAPVVGGQSKLVAPNNALVAFASHTKPLRGPAEQVPLLTPSFAVASPLQTGQGWDNEGPVKNR